MDWVWDNLQLIIIIAGGIAMWLNQLRREKNGEPADYDGDGTPDNRAPRSETRELSPESRDGSNPEQDERVRQIQEEIRRKIAERRGQGAPPPVPAPAPQLEPFNPLRPVFREQPAAPPPMPPPAPTVREVVVYDDTAALERQRRMAEQLEQLEQQRREAQRAARAVSESRGSVHAGAWSRSNAGDSASAMVRQGSPALGGRALAAELRDPQALRRAVVMREVLDPPVALR